MIQVRETFTAKPGQASKLAKLMKEVMESMGANSRVLTDVTGSFNTVVIETEAASLTEFETRMQEYGKNEALREKMKGYTDMYLTGSREIFRIVS